jgi:hypothetical protein
MAFLIVDPADSSQPHTGDSAPITEIQSASDEKSQPDFSQYILPEGSLFKPLPDFQLPESLLGPSLPNPYGQTSQSDKTDDYINKSPVPVAADYLPSKEDLRQFRFAARFASFSFSRNGLENMALNEKVPDGGRQLADYLFKNFDTIKSFTTAGDEEFIHVDDIKLLIDLAQAKRAFDTVSESREQILNSFPGIDSNGDKVLSKQEIAMASEEATEPTEKSVLEALSYTNTLFKDGISQAQLAQFNYESLFADLAQKKHHEADMANRVFWPGVAGAALGGGLGYLTKSKWWQTGFLMLGGEEIGKATAEFFIAGDVKAHYDKTAKGAIDRLF